MNNAVDAKQSRQEHRCGAVRGRSRQCRADYGLHVLLMCGDSNNRQRAELQAHGTKRRVGHRCCEPCEQVDTAAYGVLMTDVFSSRRRRRM